MTRHRPRRPKPNAMSSCPCTKFTLRRTVGAVKPGVPVGGQIIIDAQSSLNKPITDNVLKLRVRETHYDQLRFEGIEIAFMDYIFRGGTAC